MGPWLCGSGSIYGEKEVRYQLSVVRFQMSENTGADKGEGGCDKWSVVSEEW